MVLEQGAYAFGAYLERPSGDLFFAAQETSEGLYDVFTIEGDNPSVSIRQDLTKQDAEAEIKKVFEGFSKRLEYLSCAVLVDDLF